jgi:hypothetical protein
MLKIKYLTSPLTRFEGTLVCRGTPVGNHCPSQSVSLRLSLYLSFFLSIYHVLRPLLHLISVLVFQNFDLSFFFFKIPFPTIHFFFTTYCSVVFFSIVFLSLCLLVFQFYFLSYLTLRNSENQGK